VNSYQTEQSDYQDGKRGGLGDRIECLEAGYRPIQGGREQVRAAAGAPERGQVAVEAGQRIAAAEGV
jgi:hypothetical protein